MSRLDIESRSLILFHHWLPNCAMYLYTHFVRSTYFGFYAAPQLHNRSCDSQPRFHRSYSSTAICRMLFCQSILAHTRSLIHYESLFRLRLLKLYII